MMDGDARNQRIDGAFSNNHNQLTQIKSNQSLYSQAVQIQLNPIILTIEIKLCLLQLKVSRE